MRFVLRTEPIHLAANVPLDAEIQIYFMIDLQISCIKPENILLLNLESQSSEPVSLNYQNKVLTIQPLQPLKPLTHYQVELIGEKNGIIDITGRTLDSNYFMEFTTDNVNEIQPPTFLQPSMYSSISDLLFQWSAVDQAYFYELEISKSNTFQVLTWPLEETRIYESSITPAVSLTPGVQYYARIRTVNHDGIKSAYSDPIQFIYEPITAQGTGATSGSGTTGSTQLGSIQDALGSVTDTTSYLNVINTTPEDLTVNVPISADVLPKGYLKEVSMEFDEEIDPMSIDPTLFYLIAQKN